jgi:hypothetical protein
MSRNERMAQLENVIMLTRQYFVMEYHAGTRFMVERYIFRTTGENVPPDMISAALKILKLDGAISQDHRVWFWLADK